jgi:hypothetical protein
MWKERLNKIDCHHHINFSRVHNSYLDMKLTTQYKEHVHIILQLLDKKKCLSAKGCLKLKSSWIEMHTYKKRSFCPVLDKGMGK